MRLDARSESALRGVHEDLVAIIRNQADLGTIDFIVTEGVRSEAEQRTLFDRGASKTMNSRHLTGHAVDLAVMISGKVRWDWPLYKQLADELKARAREIGIPLIWGGDWRTFKDGPHFELPWKNYPK